MDRAVMTMTVYFCSFLFLLCIRHGSALSLAISACLVFIVMHQAFSRLTSEGTVAMASVGWFSGTAGLSGIIQAWSILVSDLEYSLFVYPTQTSTFQPTMSILGVTRDS
jgi:hypothetical protein